MSFLARRYKKAAFRDRETLPCCYCAKPLTRETATVDHGTPLSRGGAHVRENLYICCLDCNQAKGDMTAQEFLDSRPSV